MDPGILLSAGAGSRISAAQYISTGEENQMRKAIIGKLYR
jgi:hypothetical protein